MAERTTWRAVQGYLAHKKPPSPLGPPYEPKHGPTVGSYGVAVSYERGTPVRQEIHRVGVSDISSRRSRLSVHIPAAMHTCVRVCVCVCVCVYVCVVCVCMCACLCVYVYNRERESVCVCAPAAMHTWTRVSGFGLDRGLMIGLGYQVVRRA